jgi:hypothetical protein
LFLLLKQLITPALQLRGDGFDAGGLLDGSGFDVRGIIVAQLSMRQLCHGVSGVFIDALAKFFQHLDGGTNFVCGGYLHGQLKLAIARLLMPTVLPDGGVELTDGRVLDKGFREFLPGYAVTSYGSQGKTVDYVLFSDSTVKAATNAQQWYVTISRGRRGIRIFTPDKNQLRENVARPGHRPLALEFAAGFAPCRQGRLWNRLHGFMLRFGQRAADRFCRLKAARRHHHHHTQKYERKIT